MRKFVLLAGALCLGSTPAMAAEGGMYFDVATGVSRVHDVKKSDFDIALSPAIIQSSKLDDEGSSWSVAIGYRPWRYFAADLSYMELGAVKYRADIISGGVPLLYKASISASGPAVAAMGILPVWRFEFRARAGLLFGKTTIKEYAATSGVSLSDAFDANSRNLFGGLSAAFNITDTFAVHVGAQRFFNVGDKDTVGESDIDVFALGLTFSQ